MRGGAGSTSRSFSRETGYLLAENWTWAPRPDDLAGMPDSALTQSNHAGTAGVTREDATSNVDDLDGDGDTLVGALELASAEARERRCLELLGEGALVVRVPSPEREQRGKLGPYLEDAVEARLSGLGAPGPMPHVEDRLGDQLFRARQIGASGLVLSLDSLTNVREPALTPEDSSTLASLAHATRERPLVVLLDDGDARAAAYGRPVPLVSLFALTSACGSAVMPETRTIDRDFPVEEAAATEQTPVVYPAVAPDEDEETHFVEADTTPLDDLEAEAPTQARPVSMAHLNELAEIDETGEEDDEDELESAPVAPEPRPVFRADPEAVAMHARALAAVRGPQPLAMLKRLFLEHYLPLGEMLDRGHRDARAEQVHGTFRRNFERAYADAAPTFALTGKRPRMVLDAFEEAIRLGRSVGARTTSLLLVPSLRADLGLRMHEQVASMLAPTALVESGLLFAALPSTSARQEDTLARGVAALGQARPDESLHEAEWHARGSLRRVRIGARDLFTLDTVAAWRQLPRGPEDTDPLVEALGHAVARHAHSLVSAKSPITNGRSPERTLLYVFGDHGFVFEEDGHTRDGGSTPEEAVAPYFAYVIDPPN